MKKKGTKRTKHSKQVKHATHSGKKCVSKRTLFIVGAAFFVVFAFLLMFVTNNPQVSNSSQITGNVITGQAGVTFEQPTSTSDKGGFISSLFSGWTTGNLDTQLAKILFWVIILLLLSSVFSFAGFPPQGFLQFVLALVVSFLATAYITPEEVFSLLAGYSALGLTLITIVPFIAILLFSSMLLSNEKQGKRGVTLGKVVISVMLWAFYAVFLAYKLIAGLVTGGVSLALNLSTIILSVCLLVAVIILIFNKKFRHFIWNIGIDIRGMNEAIRRTNIQERGKDYGEDLRS